METIKEAKDFLRENWEAGTDCPCCNRYVKLYKYSFNSAMSRLMIFMYKLHQEGMKEVHIENEMAKRGIRSVQVQSKLVHWGLIEAVANDDSSKRTSGVYSLTMEGVEFSLCRLKVPKFIKYYNEKVYERSTHELISIQQGLGKKFDYNEMMSELW
jgi:hypothetical protein